MKYAKSDTSGIQAVPDDAKLKQGFKHVDVVHVRRKSDGFETVIEKDEWSKMGAPEKAAFDKMKDPEARNEEALAEQFALGAEVEVEVDPKPAAKPAAKSADASGEGEKK